VVERSYYHVLGVPRDAATDEIERAFRAIARRVHPDLHGGDGAAVERMKQLNEIRAILTDPAARAAYDARLRRAHAAAAAAASRPAQPTPAAPWTPNRSAAWMDTQSRSGTTTTTTTTTTTSTKGRQGTTPSPVVSERDRAAHMSRLIWVTVALLATLGIVITAILARDL
jgi:curved DNA-binding protein CbpA